MLQLPLGILGKNLAPLRSPCIQNSESPPKTLSMSLSPPVASDQRTALVTGGGRGIGAAVCAELAMHGLRVVVTDLAGDNAARVASALTPRSAGAHSHRVLDVTNETDVERAFGQIEQETGPIAVLVCVAGVLLHPGGQRSPISETTTQDWETTFNVNARGTFLCGRALLRARASRPVPHGRIVTFGSVAAQLGGYRSSATYISAKSAVMGLTKAMAREAAPMGITVNSIAPGLIDTDMLRSTVQGSGALDAAAQAIPLGRIGTVDDVAAAVGFLVSERASYITGSVIDVNGGYRMQ